MRYMSSHHQRKSSDTRWPQQIRIRSRLGAPFQHALMNRSQLIHVITLIRARSRIHERKHTGNKQSRLVVSYCKRSSEDSTSLSIFSLTVTEEKRIGSRIVMSQMTCLPNETTRQHCSILNTRTTRKNEIITNHTISDVYRSILITVYTTILQTACSFYLAIITNTYILNTAGIHNCHMISYRSIFCCY